MTNGSTEAIAKRIDDEPIPSKLDRDIKVLAALHTCRALFKPHLNWPWREDVWPELEAAIDAITAEAPMREQVEKAKTALAAIWPGNHTWITGQRLREELDLYED